MRAIATQTENGSRPRRRTIVFLTVSAVLFLSDVAFVIINYQNARSTLDEALETETQQLRGGFDLGLSLVYADLLQLATFIAHDGAVRELLFEAKSTVESEGGGSGGNRSQEVRGRLLAEVQPAFEAMSREFELRQLHFHLAPSSLSFLRVHHPERHGDRLDTARPIVVDANVEGVARTGFETDRLYSGLRAVVPVRARDPESGNSVHVGSLEIGTSFSGLLRALDRKLDTGFAVLLTDDHVTSNIWPEFLEDNYGDPDPRCNCHIEAYTRPDFEWTLDRVRFTSDFHQPPPQVLEEADRSVLVSFFPLRDYRGDLDSSGPPAGVVVLWRDVTSAFTAFRQGQILAITFAVLGFLLIEGMLYLALGAVSRGLQRVIETETREVREALDETQKLAQEDPLTGLPNRRSLIEDLETEIAKASKRGTPLSLILLDVDNFKRVNDQRGHVVGDRVLQDVAECIKDAVRPTDAVGRYGGEEFCLVLPHTGLIEARLVAERLRVAIQRLRMTDEDGQSFGVTSSFGVAQWLPGQTDEVLIHTADAALYESKESGRNRVSLAPPPSKTQRKGVE